MKNDKFVKKIGREQWASEEDLKDDTSSSFGSSESHILQNFEKNKISHNVKLDNCQYNVMPDEMRDMHEKLNHLKSKHKNILYLCTKRNPKKYCGISLNQNIPQNNKLKIIKLFRKFSKSTSCHLHTHKTFDTNHLLPRYHSHNIDPENSPFKMNHTHTIEQQQTDMNSPPIHNNADLLQTKPSNTNKFKTEVRHSSSLASSLNSVKSVLIPVLNEIDRLTSCSKNKKRRKRCHTSRSVIKNYKNNLEARDCRANKTISNYNNNGDQVGGWQDSARDRCHATHHRAASTKIVTPHQKANKDANNIHSKQLPSSIPKPSSKLANCCLEAKNLFSSLKHPSERVLQMKIPEKISCECIMKHQNDKIVDDFTESCKVSKKAARKTSTLISLKLSQTTDTPVLMQTFLIKKKKTEFKHLVKLAENLRKKGLREENSNKNVSCEAATKLVKQTNESKNTVSFTTDIVQKAERSIFAKRQNNLTKKLSSGLSATTACFSTLKFSQKIMSVVGPNRKRSHSGKKKYPSMLLGRGRESPKIMSHGLYHSYLRLGQLTGGLIFPITEPKNSTNPQNIINVKKSAEDPHTMNLSKPTNLSSRIRTGIAFKRARNGTLIHRPHANENIPAFCRSSSIDHSHYKNKGHSNQNCMYNNLHYQHIKKKTG